MYLISTFGTLEYNNHIIDVKSVVVDYLKRDVEILDRAITNLYYLMKNGYNVIPSNFYTITPKPGGGWPMLYLGEITIKHLLAL